jgi:hypothetical protein
MLLVGNMRSVFSAAPLGPTEPGGVEEQCFESMDRLLGSRPDPLRCLNMVGKEIPTALVLARDKDDQFYGVVAPLPCKTTGCILPCNVDASVFICQQCQCFMHKGCVHKKRKVNLVRLSKMNKEKKKLEAQQQMAKNEREASHSFDGDDTATNDDAMEDKLAAAGLVTEHIKERRK